MTHPPSLPPMPPTEPLDDAERALARALRNLPAGMPPPELDARILGAARRSVHLAQPRHRDRRWLIGLSTAATAVLAVGVMFKMHDLGSGSVVAPPPTEETASPAPMATDTAAHAEMEKDNARQPNAVLPPPPAMLPPEQVQTMALPPKVMPAQSEPQGIGGAATKPSPDAFPAARAIPPPQSPRRDAPPPPPIVIQATPAPMAVMSPPPAPPAPMVQESEEYKAAAARDERSAAMEASAAATGALSNHLQQAKTAGNAAADTSSGQALDQVTVSGSRIKRTDASDKDAVIATDDLLPAVDADLKLAPTPWIERIRERLRHGDRANAVASLHAFMRAHPDATVPDDLLPLLR